MKTRNSLQIAPPETDAMEKYSILHDIGSGDYSVVKLGVLKSTGEKRAIKIYNKRALDDPKLRKCVMREAKILKKVNHPNIVHYFEDIQGKNNFYIITEFVRGLSLTDHVFGKALKRLQENEACEIFTQILQGLEYLHRNSITHRDVRLENVMLDLQFNVKLIDFSFATCFSNSKKSLVYCGSELYMAPEIASKCESFGPPVDVWAAGVLLYAMVTGEFPFFSQSSKRVLEKVKKGEFCVPHYLSSECKQIIQDMLKPWEVRPTARELLSHPWIRSYSRSQE
jgi:serine/threonine protein kinase